MSSSSIVAVLEDLNQVTSAEAARSLSGRLELVFGLNEDSVVEIAGSRGPNLIVSALADSADVATLSTELLTALKKATNPDGHSACSFLFGGTPTPRLVLLLAAVAAHDGDAVANLTVSAALSENPLLPADTRAALLQLTANLWAKGHGIADERMIDFIDRLVAQPAREVRELEQKLIAGSNGIDHCFPVPSESIDTYHLCYQAAKRRVQQLSLIDLGRLIKAVSVTPRIAEYWDRNASDLAADLESSQTHYLSDEALADLQSDLLTPNRSVSDFVILWDEILAKSADGCHGYSAAELMRLALLEPSFGLPDSESQAARLAFYRGVLRISSDAIIGLTAGPFHVEHGNRTTNSVFYMGRGATLGKSCLIDATGNVVISSSSFLGGGFIPMLIHTHKHAGKASGVGERRSIVVGDFVARSGTRLPMSAGGLHEILDWDGGLSPWSDDIYSRAREA